MGQIPPELLPANWTHVLSDSQPADYVCPDCGAVLRYVRLMPINGRAMYRRGMCRCEEQINNQRQQEYIEKITRENLTAYSGLGALRAKTFAELKGTEIQKALNHGRRFAENYPHDRWLIYSGQVGVGKTHLAAAIANDLVDRFVRVKFVVLPELLDEIRDSYGNESSINPVADLYHADVVIIDDLGAHKVTEWATEEIYKIINNLYNLKRAVVITTNFDTYGELRACVGARTADRMIHKAVWCSIAGQSHRQKEFIARRTGDGN